MDVMSILLEFAEAIYWVTVIHSCGCSKPSFGCFVCCTSSPGVGKKRDGTILLARTLTRVKIVVYNYIATAETTQKFIIIYYIHVFRTHNIYEIFTWFIRLCLRIVLALLSADNYASAPRTS